MAVAMVSQRVDGLVEPLQVVIDVAEILGDLHAQHGYARTGQVRDTFEEWCDGVLHDGQALLAGIQLLDRIARHPFGRKDASFDPVQFILERVEKGKVTINDRIHQRIEDVAGPLLEELGLTFAARADLLEAFLGVAPDRNDVARARKDCQFPHVVIRLAGLYDMQHHEERITIFLDLGPLVAGLRILHGERMQVECLLQLREVGRFRVSERHPYEGLRFPQVFGNLARLYL